MRKRVLVAFAAVLVLLLGGAPAHAQGKHNSTPLFTHVSFWSVPRANWEEMAKVSPEVRGILDSLVADGTLVGYGFFQNRVHSEEGYTHASWYQATSLANLLKALDAILSRPGVSVPVLASSKHWDYIMISTDYGAKAITNSSGYIRVISSQIKAGKTDEFLETYRRYFVPVYEKLLADGTIVSYQLDSEYIIQNAPGRYFSVVITRDGEGLDKVRAAFGDLFDKNPAAAGALVSSTEPNSRNDLLGRIGTMTRK